VRAQKFLNFRAQLRLSSAGRIEPGGTIGGGQGHCLRENFLQSNVRWCVDG
jgi:hypothetical protein